MSRIAGAIFGILFGLVFGVGVLVGGYFMYSWQTAVQDYKPIEATVVSSELSETTGDEGGTQYSPHIVYNYTVDGKEYESDSYYYVDMSTDNRDWAATAVNEHPEGSTCTAYYSPENPQDSVLVRDTEKLGFLAWIPYILMAVGGGILLIPVGLVAYLLLMAGILFQGWKKSRERQASAAGPQAGASGSGADDDSSGSGGMPNVEEL